MKISFMILAAKRLLLDADFRLLSTFCLDKFYKF